MPPKSRYVKTVDGVDQVRLWVRIWWWLEDALLSRVEYVQEESGYCNIFERKHQRMPRGHVLHGHQHNFDHKSTVFWGALRIQATLPSGERVDRIFLAPDTVWIRAEVEHEITSLRRGTTMWCQYAHQTPQGEIVQEYTGWQQAYT
jgi:hypothetical protein